jgi:hypothetical protein
MAINLRFPFDLYFSCLFCLTEFSIYDCKIFFIHLSGQEQRFLNNKDDEQDINFLQHALINNLPFLFLQLFLLFFRLKPAGVNPTKLGFLHFSDFLLS